MPRVDDLPDLASAKTYVETANPDAGDKWFVLPDDTVLYQRRSDGELQPALIPAHTLKSSPTWSAAT
jgi:hypothetical protein